MSDVNKLDSTQCPFDPEQYKVKKTKAVNVEFEVDGVPPVGTFPWAIIQVYLGHWVRRDGWSPSSEYIKLIPSSTSNDGKNIPPQIGIVEKNSELTSWQPTQDDMMACDWELVKAEIKPICPEDTMLSFDLKVGTSQYLYVQQQAQDWGYLTEGVDKGENESTFGTLTNLQSTIGIGNILSFTLTENPIGTFYIIALQVDTQNQPNLGGKTLEVVVNGSTYNLGAYASNATNVFLYMSDGAKQLGDLLKQNVGKTLHFCFNWK
ncbi:DUF2829 domain-containing protein [Xenorhabdus sp. KK7.4]|uniref:DUF2829 domain-containing protein n=1 Tax=Xenorhabdus sp. KK7.4 TaxID=1851572 RepID=UPI000C03D96B|nr:DUF2829 domain-containing protein [Xenorhabdus sp. KK7.4]PHM56711.1 hypothetical protein Xekk_01618 [Xenorhabdus sp. KK7.4]